MFRWTKKLNSINSNNFNGAKINGDSDIVINDKAYKSKSINISNNKIIIDGKEVGNTENNTVVNIEIYLKEGSKVENATTISGNIEIHGDIINAKTTSGDITVIEGNINGNVNTVSGDVQADKIEGNVNTVSGDIIEK